MKKTIFSLLTLLGIIFLTGCGSSNSEKNTSETTETSQSPSKVFDFEGNGFTGTYQFTDEKGVTCTIELKEDNTFTASSSKSDDVKTGTWVVYNNDCPQLKFDDTDDPLFFTFPEGKEQKIKQTINDGVITEDGYIYAMNIYYDVRNEDKRLPIKKLN